jgi:hypothetical protein
MDLTRDFKGAIDERAKTDAEIRVGLLTEAAECLLNNETAVAKILLRDYEDATLGFQKLRGLAGLRELNPSTMRLD